MPTWTIGLGEYKMDFVVENSSDLSPKCNNSLSHTERDRLLWVLGGTAMASFTMCAVAASAVLCLRLYKYFSYRLAVYQVMSALLFNLAQILSLTLLGYDGSKHYQISCKVDAVMLEYTVWVKLLFTLCLSFHFFCLTVCLRNFENLEVLYVLISLLFPLLFSWIPFIHDLYGLAGAWCWIKEWRHDCASHHYPEGIIEQFVLWYGPLFVSLTVVLIGFLVIPIVLAWRMYICRQKTNSESEHLLGNEKQKEINKAVKRLLPLLAYPAIFYVLAMFPLVNRIYSAASHYASYSLALAHAITEPLWGFFTSWALIIHILLIRHLIKKQQKQKIEIGAKPVADFETAVFTAASTNHIFPEESDVDQSE